MIKPFTILSTRVEADGTLGVQYKVQMRQQISPTEMHTKTLESYMSCPKDADVDAYVFEQLSKAGWIQ